MPRGHAVTVAGFPQSSSCLSAGKAELPCRPNLNVSRARFSPVAWVYPLGRGGSRGRRAFFYLS